jgi:hypothetical protein
VVGLNRSQVHGLFQWKWRCGGFLSLFYIYCCWRFNYQEGSVGIPLNGLIPPHICVCPKAGPQTSTSSLPLKKTMHLRIAQKCGRVKHLFIGLWCLTSLSTIFQLYGGGQFYWQEKLEYPEKTTDLPKYPQLLVGLVLLDL